MDITNIIAVGDLHAGSSVAICPPTVALDDGGTYHASRGQRWLWECWLDFCAQASKLEGRRVVVLNGDLLEFDARGRSHQMITRNRANITQVALDVLAPLVDSADAVYVIRGTEAHTGKSATGEEQLAQDLDNATGQSDTVKSWWHLVATAAGVRFDIAHHAQMGSMPWSERNAANKIAYMARARYLERDEKPPHVVLRSHVHRYSDSGGNFDTFAVTMPAWTLRTSYIYRIAGENALSDNGGLFFTCAGGKYDYHKKVYPPKKDRVWKLQL